jgi:pyruvate dehydrogenase E2 component (dihydrolipoyllysine-residue acetyltransferase)
MASPVVMPKMSDTMEEGVVVKWLKHEGERVAPGEPLAEIETDKAVLELEAHDPGVLRKILVQEDHKIPVGQLMAVIASEDEDISPLVGGVTTPSSRPATPMSAASPATSALSPPPTPPEAPSKPPQATISRERIDASPLARRMAAEAGIDIAQVHGTGPGGRVVKRDIEAFLAQHRHQVAPLPTADAASSAASTAAAMPTLAADAEPADFEARELSMLRKTIARRMAQSKATVPHFYVSAEIDMSQAVALRQSLHEVADERSKISYNDMILKAVANALRQFPRLNASYHEDTVRLHQRVHIGMAVALDEGLITPVLRDCDRKSLGEIAREARELAERARARRLKPDEYTGGTFSVSNLGMFEVDACSAIINPPEAAILAVGAIKEQPVVINGQLTVGLRMQITLSCDHRVVDGATAAQFLQIVKRLLEQPLMLML